MAQCLRLICFLTIVVLVFVDIYCTFRYVSVNFDQVQTPYFYNYNDLCLKILICLQT